MITIVMREKTLTCTTTAQIHQYENNSDQIKCILPCTYEGNSLKNATVILLYKDENGYGGQLEFTISDEMFSNDYYQYFNRINSFITSHVGKLTIWLKICDSEINLSFETGETSFNILPIKELPKNIKQEQKSYFDQWLVKITQIQNTTLKIQRDTINLANSTRIDIDKLKNDIAILKGGGIIGD